MYTNLSQYIRNQGAPAFAERYGVNINTARSWLYGKRFPTRKRASKLIKISNGELTLDIVFAAQAG